uniref:Lipoprotein n=1 Tax=Candidatus Kentrum sp. TC TaxID=2126339 RepID=A0A450YPE0_9GAMM|nr:MAG: hypothetical protein BECKTC1821E_GA0114239_102514 [Candidatus Kentron sp. TC]
MNRVAVRSFNHAAILSLLMFLVGCAPLIGPHSPEAYKKATSLKSETLALMDKATEPYSTHADSVEGPKGHTASLNSAYEYVAGLDSNAISAKQWKILISEDGDLYGKFIKRWKEKSTLSETFITEFKGPVSDAFDEIICLEANEKESTECGKSKGE